MQKSNTILLKSNTARVYFLQGFSLDRGIFFVLLCDKSYNLNSSFVIG